MCSSIGHILGYLCLIFDLNRSGNFIHLYFFSLSKENSNTSISAYKGSLDHLKAAAASSLITQKIKEI